MDAPIVIELFLRLKYTEYAHVVQDFILKKRNFIVSMVNHETMQFYC